MRILLLGGTAEASELARQLAGANIDALFSYAGRTTNPIPQALPTRIGGFGGIDGLLDCFREEGITHVVDATHPFASRISCNLQAATAQAALPLITLQRPPWTPVAGDDWREVASLDDAVKALPTDPARVFLAIGRQTIGVFSAAPQHHYLLRFVDPPEDEPLPLPNATVVVSRGPYRAADDHALLEEHGVNIVVAKNSGGSGGAAKLQAARELALPVIMVARPARPEGSAGVVLNSPAAVMEHLTAMP
ncbi:MAG: cobalt-precorrin-6A reductase [Gammaproteobacteria bacterium]|nr:MAG: cobalt-precorrin-6A reductase [Gammaproteobacteria bacterium]